jgi:hypothetical protein
MAILAAVLLPCSYIAGGAYPVAFCVIWAVYAATLAFVVADVRRDLKNA